MEAGVRERMTKWLHYLGVHVCVCVFAGECISMCDSLCFHLSTDETVKPESKNVSAPFLNIARINFLPLCFSTLMLRLDINKVPKAEETKKWKVWLDAHLLISSLWVSLVCVSISLHACSSSCLQLCSVVWTPLWTFFRLFSGLSKCKVNTPPPPNQIDYKLNEFQLSIDPLWPASTPAPTAIEYKWLAVRKPAHQQRRQASAVFGGHTAAGPADCQRHTTALKPQGLLNQIHSLTDVCWWLCISCCIIAPKFIRHHKLHCPFAPVFVDVLGSLSPLQKVREVQTS